MKTSVSLRAPRLVALLAFAFASLSVSNLSAQTTVSTVPVGAVNVTIAAGTGAARVASIVSFPLQDEAVITGQSQGQISSVTANTIVNNSAGWTAGQLSTAATPNILLITSGAAVGRTFLISTATANTSTTVTIDTEEAGLVNLTTLGINAGDTYKILACDTINSLFGGPAQTGVQANTNVALADTIQLLVSGTYRTYFHNGTQWVRQGPNTPSNNVPIRPDTFLAYNRLAATPIQLTLTGTVPSVARKAIVRNGGATTLSTLWPVNLTLATSGIQNLPGWVNGTPSTTGTADIVQVLVSGTYRSYYFNGTNWARVGPNTNSDTVAISTGSGLLINKRGTATGSTPLSQVLPYSVL